MQRVHDVLNLLQLGFRSVDPDRPLPPSAPLGALVSLSLLDREAHRCCFRSSIATHCGVAIDVQRFLTSSAWTWMKLSSSAPRTHTNVPPGSASGLPICQSERASPLIDRY